MYVIFSYKRKNINKYNRATLLTIHFAIYGDITLIKYITEINDIQIIIYLVTYKPAYRLSIIT